MGTSRKRTPAQTEKSFWAKVERHLGCWNWTGALATNGHAVFCPNGRLEPAARFAYRLLVGPIPDGLWVLHRCDNGRCVNPDHLYLGTVKDNARDMVERGRAAKGEKNANAKLTDHDIRGIRIALTAHVGRLVDIADLFGVTKTTIHTISTGKTWRHVA